MQTLAMVEKWGDSLAVRIPSQFAKAKKIDVGAVLDLDAVKILSARRRYKLSELMAQFKPEHRNGEWDLGGPVGREGW